MCIFCFIQTDPRNVICTLYLWCPLNKYHKCLMGLLFMVFTFSYLHLILLFYVLHIFLLNFVQLDCQFLILSFTFFFHLLLFKLFKLYYICIHVYIYIYTYSFMSNVALTISTRSEHNCKANSIL